LYNILLSQVPPEKIHFKKRVLSCTQSEYGVLIRTGDGATHEGDILVGADGAYSSVRQNMYEQLKKAGNLPKSDQQDLPFSCTCLVGQTLPLDPEEYPQLKNPLCQFNITLGEDQPYTVRF
jgi:2-polyprenyl-6-methoxyphenol hydroxylase-like FAD-dependent oxidoreductase